MIRTYKGKRALHDINGIISIVNRRSFLFSNVLVAIIAGTLQPNPINRGMNDLPCNPILCISLSIMNATLAIYPESSIKDINKNSINMLGKNTITPPTPPITPSMIRSWMAPSGINFPKKSPSNDTPLSIHSIG